MENLPIPQTDPVLSVVVIVLCVLCVAFFSSSEAALISVSRLKIRGLVEKGNKQAKAVSRLREEHDRLFGTILLTENFFIILASSLGTALAISIDPDHEWVTVIASVVMTVFIVMFGEIAPKTFAASHSTRMALIVGRPMEFIVTLMHPLVWLFTSVTNRAIALVAGKREVSPFVTEEEIKTIITIGEEEGTLDVGEKAMLHKVFEFGDTQAVEAMRPRTEIISVDKDARVSEALALVAEHGHSRYPVVEDNVDNVQGVLYVKDLLIGMSKGEIDNESPITRLVRAAYFVPETKRVKELLSEMQAQKIQMVIVIDEYGGTAGMVTLEDLMEEIVGSIQDEYDREEKEVQIVDEKNFVVSGTADIDEVNGEIGTTISSDDFNTIGGFLFGLFGRMPRAGESLKYKELKFEVLEMDGRKIGRLKITKL
ncbi:MAG: HlyC/CorC family transporter [Nitrospirae bacterium]|nr:HlyC/CorC family transporter [Nitrospirota bacterium]